MYNGSIILKLNALTTKIKIRQVKMKALVLVAVIVVGVSAIPNQQQLNMSKKPQRCPTVCPMYIITFCGSDGHTHRSNPCFVKAHLCRGGDPDYEQFTIRHLGPCAM